MSTDNGLMVGEGNHETFAWMVLAQLVRRHPDRLWVQTETHSIGSEQAFIIDVSAQEPRAIGFLGLPGANATSYRAPAPESWNDAWLGDDPAGWIEEFERSLGLTPPTGRLPPSTPSSLALRWVSELLRAQLGGLTPWIAGGEHRWAPATSLAPAASLAQASTAGLAPLCVGPRDEEPRHAVTPEGDLWGRSGLIGNLRQLHRDGSSITRLLVETVPDELP